MDSEQELADARHALHALANPASAEQQQRYFKTCPGEYGEGDRFIGVRVLDLRRLARDYRALPVAACTELLRSVIHEERLLALLILVFKFQKGDAATRTEIHTVYLKNTAFVNSWDLVDSSAEHLVGAHLDPGDTALLEQLARSEQLWERRIAIMATFCWIKRGEFSGALRIADLLRYAIEKFPAERRKAYLAGTVEIDQCNQSLMTRAEIARDFSDYIRVALESQTYRSICNELYGDDLVLLNTSHPRELREILRLAAVESSSKVLDVGCGTGSIIRHLAQTCDCECTGIDFARDAMDYLSNTFPAKGVSYRAVDIDDLSSLRQALDVILRVDAFFLATDPQGAIEELLTRVAPGGRLIIAHSQYPLTDRDKKLINTGSTMIDPILDTLDVSFRSYDRTEQELNYWRSMSNQVESGIKMVLGFS